MVFNTVKTPFFVQSFLFRFEQLKITRMRRAIFSLLPLAALALTQCKKGHTSPGGGSNAQSGIVRISSLSAKSVEADSVSTCLITVQLASTLSPGENAVVFYTNLGQFPNGLTRDTAVADADGVAVMPLTSDAAGDAMIRAAIDEITVDTSIGFTPALPDDMLCTANQYTGPDSVDFIMTCNLYRNPGRGKVTDPIKVLFSFTPAVGNNASPALLVPSFANSGGGIITNNIQNPYRDTGTFVIQAAAPLDNGSTLYRSVTLIIH
jgi:hypothetical protein